MNNLIKFREIYTYLNEETLIQALKDNQGELIVKMLLRDQLGRVAVGCILLALGESIKSEYVSLLWHYTKNTDPYIRERAYMSLASYPDEERPQYNYFINKFKNNLMEEESKGIQEQLICQIEWMEEIS